MYEPNSSVIPRHVERSWSSPATGLLSRLVVGLATVAAAVLIRIPLEPILQGRNPFILIEPAIAIAAWYGGRASGTTATLAGVAVSILFYLQSGPLALQQ